MVFDVREHNLPYRGFFRTREVFTFRTCPPFVTRICRLIRVISGVQEGRGGSDPHQNSVCAIASNPSLHNRGPLTSTRGPLGVRGPPIGNHCVRDYTIQGRSKAWHVGSYIDILIFNSGAY